MPLPLYMKMPENINEATRHICSEKYLAEEIIFLNGIVKLPWVLKLGPKL